MTAPARGTDSPVGIAGLRRDVRQQLFRGVSSGRWQVGAEVELIPVTLDGGRPVPVHPEPDGPSSLGFLRPLARARGWTETVTAYGVPCFTVPEIGGLSFEPGGQIELSTLPFASPSRLLAAIRGTVEVLRQAAGYAGVALLETGLDPVNAVTAVPLRLPVRRYARMARYFDGIGDSGARMMRQTASCQFSLDVPPDAVTDCWRALNTVAPVIIAAFANSPVAEARRTGYASNRARIWQHVDPARTGIMLCVGDCAEYLDRALDAPSFLLGGEQCAPVPLRDWLDAGALSLPAWREHLTTLFPEVRPRGYIEVRGCDMIGADARSALLVLLCAMVRDFRVRGAACEMLGGPRLDLYSRAPAAGSDLLGIAASLLRIALASAVLEPPGFWSAADLGAARTFAEEFTCRGRTPADARTEHSW